MSKLPEGPVVYFIQAGESGPVKIGYTANLYARLSELQVGNYQELLVRAIIDDESAIGDAEYRMHEKFRKSQIRGERFWPTQDLRQFMWENAWPRRVPVSVGQLGVMRGPRDLALIASLF